MILPFYPVTPSTVFFCFSFILLLVSSTKLMYSIFFPQYPQQIYSLLLFFQLSSEWKIFKMSSQPKTSFNYSVTTHLNSSHTIYDSY